ncbi:GNAT family N-acetyltransferase [Ancylobacter defluvii]|uniref:N-acetyltransferase GCN5 n=1 Tax=Ancylobacter defluvii TaxID=1282440 RepID=A0A9W6JVP9_9HYPH|nr:GNAT family N-acetyltransferase [Ancylobacter defluvii]MBS7590107.1 GNAT family N-acetyltransferase [Ancylobacter defluvii]GLK82729.1 N-acetyltransferase GCN5 [Ancylobacter defluvii]
MSLTISLKPAETVDYAFALDLYLMTMRPLTSQLMTWDEGRQIASFAHQWRGDEVRIILLDGSEVGWIQTREEAPKIRLLQFFIMPDQQGRGIGSEVLAQLLAQGDSAGKPVTLAVLRNNPARRLYERFGFTVVDETGLKLRMERQSSPM